MVYWLILVVYGIGSGGFTVTTQASQVGNYSDLKARVAAKDSQGSGSLDNWRSNYALRSSLRRQSATSVETDAVSAMVRTHQPGEAVLPDRSCRKTLTGSRSAFHHFSPIGRAHGSTVGGGPLCDSGGQGSARRHEADAPQTPGGPHLHGHVRRFSTSASVISSDRRARSSISARQRHRSARL